MELYIVLFYAVWFSAGLLGTIFIMFGETCGTFCFGEDFLPKKQLITSAVLIVVHIAFGLGTLVLGVCAIGELKKHLEWR
jgi:hypothetical protein